MPTALVNGSAWGWASIKLNLFGVPVVGVTEIEYGQKQKKENLFGAGNIPIARGYGNKEPEGSISLYLDEWNKIIAAAATTDPNDIPPFNIQVLFGKTSINFKQDNLLACEFADDPFTAKQGDTKFIVKIPLIIGLVKHVAF